MNKEMLGLVSVVEISPEDFAAVLLLYSVYSLALPSSDLPFRSEALLPWFVLIQLAQLPQNFTLEIFSGPLKYI